MLSIISTEVINMRKAFLLVAAVFAVFTLAACEQNFTNIDNDQLREFLENEDDYQFIDVRTPSEFYDERIPGFNINIDYYKLEDDYSLLEGLDKDKPVVIMCNSGNRSVSAANIFASEGFVEVYNLTDGIQGWDGETE